MIYSNLHAHTTYCDGANTPREMVAAALAREFDSVGLSGHAYTPFDTSYCMTPEGTEEYYKELRRLKTEYTGRIEVYAGIEQDLFSPPPVQPFDYVIGAVHYLRVGEEYLPVDESAEDCRAQVSRCFGGDWYAWCETYYRQMAGLAAQTACDIVAHFDLITKYNECNLLFNENDARYRRAALDALVPLLDSGALFEVNTGAMARGLRSTPYPAPFLLRAIREAGGSILLASDSHDIFSLDYGFAEALRYVRACGFPSVKVLTAGGFADLSL